MEMVEVSSIEAIMSTFKNIDFINLCFHNPTCFFAKNISERVAHIMKINSVDEVWDPYVHKHFSPTPRVMPLFDENDFEKVDSLFQKSNFENLQGMYPDKGIYEYTRNEIAKDRAIDYFVQKRNDSLKNVIVFGDSFNDITMIRNCGIGVAMHNAQNIVKENADMITTLSNDEGGVCDMLYKIYGEKRHGK